MQKKGFDKISRGISETKYSFLIPGLLLSLGFVLIIIYSILSVPHWTIVLSVISMVMLASFSVGALVGFIFGIPRTLQEDDKAGVKSNSNLEQLSDWLTKIIVGVGLVEFKEIFGLVNTISTDLSQGLTSSPTGYTIISSTLIFYFFGGFFISYIWSRIYLEKIFKINLAEETESRIADLEQTKNIQEEIDELRKGSFSEEKAMSVIDKALKQSDPKEHATVFDKVISIAYEKFDYVAINNLANAYDKKLQISAKTWADIAIANMNLYSGSRNKVYRDSTLYASERSIASLKDYGTPRTIKLYLELIDYSAIRDTDDELAKENIRQNIKDIVDEIKLQNPITAYEALNYLNSNDSVTLWKNYNEIFASDFPEEFASLKKRYQQYIMKGTSVK